MAALSNTVGNGSLQVRAANPVNPVRSMSSAPLVMAWEVTRACPYRCSHCRADAQPRRHPDELNTQEGLDLIEQAASMGVDVFVITGGDPLARPDVFELIEAAATRGMHVGFSPSVTPRLTPAALRRAVDAGVGTVHLSLDGARPDTHDALRGIRGSFKRTIASIEACAWLPVRLQVGTTVCRATIGDLTSIPALVGNKTSSWTLFFLVPTGRAHAGMQITPAQYEEVLTWLATSSLAMPVRTIEGPAFRRVLAELGKPVKPGAADGRGFFFVSHLGDVCPSGFLQLPVGNVRDERLGRIYNDAPLMQALRDPSRLQGACGSCNYRDLCGGSRARAWAAGDPMGSDPLCVLASHSPGADPPSTSRLAVST